MNPGPPACHAGALPTAPQPRFLGSRLYSPGPVFQPLFGKNVEIAGAGYLLRGLGHGEALERERGGRHPLDPKLLVRGVDACGESHKDLVQRRRRGREVDADGLIVAVEAAKAAREFVAHEMFRRVIEAEAGAVDPREIGRFRREHGHAVEACDGLHYAIAVDAELFDQREAPRFTVAVSGFGGDVAKLVDMRHEAVAGRLESFAERGIFDDGE